MIDKAFLRTMAVLPAWLFAAAMLMAFLGSNEMKVQFGPDWRLITYGVPLLFFFMYFPFAVWFYRRKGTVV